MLTVSRYVPRVWGWVCRDCYSRRFALTVWWGWAGTQPAAMEAAAAHCRALHPRP